MRALLISSLVLLCSSLALAQDGVSAPPKVVIQDEGSTQGSVRTLNCVGSGITCTVSGATATVTAAGGSGTFAITQTEIDFDTCGIGSDGAEFETCSTTITDAAVSATSKVMAEQAGVAATGRDADENEMDQLVCTTLPASGSFTLVCTSQQGPTHSKFKVNYTVG